jgi:heme/copper-type cytochrome/quinol oxidase subunit 1
MIKLLFKSAFYYTLFSKYGKKLLFIALNIFFMFSIQCIYPDIVDYINSAYEHEMLKNYLLYALLIKIGLFLLNIGLILYILYKIFNASDKDDNSIESQLKKKKASKEDPVENIDIEKKSYKVSGKSIEDQIREKEKVLMAKRLNRSLSRDHLEMKT